MGKDDKQTVMPRLRFPKFRKHLGWEETTLGVEATFHKGRGVSRMEIDPTGDCPCIRYGELYTRYGEVIAHVFSRTSSPESSLFLSRKNDVIIPATGETKEDIAKASCVMLDDVALGSDLNVIRTRHNGVFLSYFLNGAKKREIAKVAQGHTVAHLYPSQLENISIAFPSDQKEQQHIADCLTSLDEVIATQGRKVEALKTHNKGLMQQLFPREEETLPRIRFPAFRNSKEWGSCKVGDVLVKKAEQATLDENGTYQEIGVRSHGKGLFHKKPGTGKSIGAKRVYHVVPNALVINIVFAWEQAIAVTTQDEVGFIASHRFPMFIPKANRCDVAFMQRLFLMPVGKQLLKVASPGGAGRNRTLSQKEFENLEVIIPSTAEQQQIAACLVSFDARLAAEVDKLAALKIHKTGLMQQLFPSPEGD